MFNQILIGLLSTVLGSIIVFYLKNKWVGPIPINKIKYTTWTIEYIHPSALSLSKLKIVYNKIKCDNLKETRLAFWNNSNKTVNGDDISRKAPLIWNAHSKHKILDASIVQQTNIGIGASIRIINNRHGINIFFDYLEPKHGFVISIIHTGPSYFYYLFELFRKDDRVLGSIKGFGEVSKIYGHPNESSYIISDIYKFFTTRPSFNRRFLITILIPLMIGIIYFSIKLYLSSPQIHKDIFTFMLSLFLLSMPIAYSLIVVLSLLFGKVPKSLTAFNKKWY
jgi:hypothetical protein